MAKKKKKRLTARVCWLMEVVISLIAAYVIFQVRFLPFSWRLYAVLGIIGIDFFLALLSIPFYKSFLVKLLDILVAIALAIISWGIPHYTSKVSDLFGNSSTETIRVYVLNETYRSEHPELNYHALSSSLSDYKDAVWITSLKGDEENQDYALKEIRNEIGDIETYDCWNAVEQVTALYNGYGDVLVMADAMITTVVDSYNDFLDDVVEIAHFTREVKADIVQSDVNMTSEPFVIYFGGNDEEGSLGTYGRFDVNMIVTVNPKTYQIAIVSIPRDSYVENPAYDYAGDKLTHLGLKGISNTLEGLQNLFSLPSLNNYVLVNFTTFKNIIDGIGGVDVENDVEFTAIDGQHYPAGKIHLEGAYALMYVREREAFATGDLERNLHQQLVLEAMIQKMTSTSVILHFNSLLDRLNGSFITNIKADSIYALAAKQLALRKSWEIVKYRVEGEMGLEECASAPGYNLSVIYPDETQLETISSTLREILTDD